MTGPALSAFTACQTVLARIVSTYQAAGITLPGRQYISVGQPIVDPCEQLVVYIDRTYRGQVGQPISGPVICGGPIVATVNAELWRCAPPVHADAGSFTPPDPAAESLASSVLYSDLILLIVAADAAVTTLGLNGEANSGTVTPLPRAGGFSGMRATLLLPVPLP